MHRRFRRVALAVTAVVLVGIAGAVTYAFAGIGSGGVITGCYQVKPGSHGHGDDGHHGVSGQLRLIDPATDRCRRNEKPISWNQKGPTGPQGPKGDKGDPATSLWAVVNGANGSLARSSGTTASSRIAAGQYRVDFNRNVTACTYLATIGNPGISVPPTGTIRTALRVGTTNAVFVATTDLAGTLADRNFHLAVFC